jgi:hypothetical protein
LNALTHAQGALRGKPAGTFLVREEAGLDNLELSIAMGAESVSHVPVTVSNGVYTVGRTSAGRFPTIEALIAALQQDTLKYVFR